MRLFTLGEALIRLSPSRAGERLSEAREFIPFVGGAELNLACILSQLGHQTFWVSKLPCDPLGERIIKFAQHFNVNTEGVVLSEGDQVGVYFADPHPPFAEVVYVRRSSAFSTLKPEEVDWSLLERSDWLHLTGITPALGEGPKRTWQEAFTRARALGKGFSLDLNYRSKLWPPQEARSFLEPYAKRAEVLICSLEDARRLFGAPKEPEEACAFLKRELGPKVVALTAGREGAWASKGEGVRHHPPFEVEVRDPIGAGDAFSAGFLHGLWRGGVEEGLVYGSALAALKCATPGDVPSFSPEEVQAFIEGGGEGVRR